MKQCCTSEPLKRLVNFQNSGWTGNTYLYHLFMFGEKSMKYSLFPYHFRKSKFQFKKKEKTNPWLKGIHIHDCEEYFEYLCLKIERKEEKHFHKCQKLNEQICITGYAWACCEHKKVLQSSSRKSGWNCLLAHVESWYVFTRVKWELRCFKWIHT